MSSIFSRFIKVSLMNFTAHRAGFSQSPSRQFFLLHYVKRLHDHTHNHHGLPGIPKDGKVVLLKNSKTGAKVYLVGTDHSTQESVRTVRKVINSVRPDVVAIQLCRKRALALKKWKPENDNLFKMFIRSMRSPGGLITKIGTFLLNVKYRKIKAYGIIPGEEFKVAMEESLRVNAKVFAIDEDIGVLRQQIIEIINFDFLERSVIRAFKHIEIIKRWYYRNKNLPKEYRPRSFTREERFLFSLIFPELFKVLAHGRENLMFTTIRGLEGKSIVAVVGVVHMDMIEQLWEYVENADSKQPPATSEAGQQRRRAVKVVKK